MKEFAEEYQKELSQISKFIELQEFKESNLIAILHKAQEIFGYIPEYVQIFVANELNISVAKVNGVVSFYSYFTTKKTGKYVINICLGTACFVKGADIILEELKKQLNIDLGETTSDGLFSLESIRCIGACGLAPVISINGKIIGNLKVTDIANIIAEYRGQKSA